MSWLYRELLRHMSDTDNITKPNHYTRLHPEPLDVIEAWGLNYNQGCVIKYVARAGHKPGEPAIRDLKKAQEYIRRLIAIEELKDSDNGK